MAVVAEDIRPRLHCQLATEEAQLRASQQLRYRIFAEEMGAQIDGGPDKLDRDHFDPHCQHLIVSNEHGEIIASTRLLTCDGAIAAGEFYSEHEFDIRAIKRLQGRKLEVGRTCVHPDYRSGASIATLWSGLAAFVRREQIDYLFGCASIGLDDADAAYFMLQDIEQRYMSAPDLRVAAHQPLPARAVSYQRSRMPPLLKAYVSLGARACGPAYWDTDFNCADVFMLLNLRELHPRYAKRFLGTSAL